MTFSVPGAGAVILHLLGWSLLHFLWQAALLALVLGAVLAVARNSSAQSRYVLCCAVLALMALCPVVTFAYLARSAGNVPHLGLLTAGVNAGPVEGAQEWQHASVSLLERIAALADQRMPWILAVWIAGVLLLLIRAVVANVAVQKLRGAAIIPAPESLLALARRVAAQLGITQAFEVFASQAVNAPTLIGWLKPVILFPVASLTGLAPEQLEAMLAHELAHVRRRDYLVNALQVAMETLLFYHPAVWWVSQQIRREREHCCDDVVVAVTGEPLVYAKALYLLEEQRARAPQLMLGGNGGQLSMRIRRLLMGRQAVSGSYGAAGWMLTVVLLVLTGGLVISAVTMGKARAQSAAPSAEGNEIPWSEAMRHLQHLTPPKYPEIAMAAHISGDVQIAITIGLKGDVEAAHVVSGSPMLTQVALDSAIHSKFSPFADQPVTTTVTIFFRRGYIDGGNGPVEEPPVWCTYYGNHNAMTCGLAQNEHSASVEREEFTREFETRRTHP